MLTADHQQIPGTCRNVYTVRFRRTKSYEWRRSQLLALEQMIKTEVGKLRRISV